LAAFLESAFSWRRPSGPLFVAPAIFVAGDFAYGYAATRLGQFWLQLFPWRACPPVSRTPR
jgi:hypothetical protein